MLSLNANLQRPTRDWLRRVKARAALAAVDKALCSPHWSRCLDYARYWADRARAHRLSGEHVSASECVERARECVQQSRRQVSPIDSLAWREFTVALLAVA